MDIDIGCDIDFPCGGTEFDTTNYIYHAIILFA